MLIVIPIATACQYTNCYAYSNCLYANCYAYSNAISHVIGQCSYTAGLLGIIMVHLELHVIHHF